VQAIGKTAPTVECIVLIISLQRDLLALEGVQKKADPSDEGVVLRGKVEHIGPIFIQGYKNER